MQEEKEKIISWNFWEWCGVACIPIVLVLTFLFPSESKTTESTQEMIEQKQIESPLYSSEGVLFLKNKIQSFDFPQPLSLQSYDFAGKKIYNISVRNNWLIVHRDDGVEESRGQLQQLSSPDYNCLGFIQPDLLAIGLNGIESATKTYAICQSLVDQAKKSVTSNSNNPTTINLKKDELFFLKHRSVSLHPSFIMKLRVD